MIRQVYALLSATFVAACSNPAEPDPVLTVAIHEQSAGLTAGSVAFRGVLEMRNPGAHPIYVADCSTSLEWSASSDRWHNITGGGICTLDIKGLPQLLKIPANESRIVPIALTVQTDTSNPHLPRPYPSGSYRYRIGFLVENRLMQLALPEGTGHAIRAVTSNVFTLVVP